MMTVKLALAALVAGTTGMGMVYLLMARPHHATAKFVCPELQPRTTRMALEETTSDVARYSAALSGPERENAIRQIAADLKRRYPQSDGAEIVTYLLTAYCPTVKEQSGLSDQEKREMMDRFAAQSYALVLPDRSPK
jgi:hypothetical protein